MNTLLYLLEKYPDLPWDCEYLSSNPNITIKYIKNNLDKDWNWISLSDHISYDDFINNPNLPWDYNGLSYNKNIPISYIKNNLYVNRNVNLNKNWDWNNISYRVTYKEFLDNQELPWNYDELSKNSNIPISYIKNNLYVNRNVNLNKNWNWNDISQRVTYEEFINNPILPWDYFYLSENINIPLEYIKNNLYDNTNVNLYKDWYWWCISGRVIYKEFINNQDLPWNYESLSMNKNIPIEYIKNNLDKNWEWMYISERVTYKEFIDNPNLPWRHLHLSYNKDIPFEHLKKNLDKYVDLFDLFDISQKVTYKEFIDNLTLSWNFEGLSLNLFDYESCILAKKIMNVIINDEKYIAKVYNPNRMRSVKSLCELEELKSEFGWTDEEFDKYVK